MTMATSFGAEVSWVRYHPVFARPIIDFSGSIQYHYIEGRLWRLVHLMTIFPASEFWNPQGPFLEMALL